MKEKEGTVHEEQRICYPNPFQKTPQNAITALRKGTLTIQFLPMFYTFEAALAP
jgi:hypothetical protein